MVDDLANTVPSQMLNIESLSCRNPKARAAQEHVAGVGREGHTF